MKLHNNNNQNTSSNDNPRDKKLFSRFKNISGTLILIITAPLIALLITSHVFQSYEVDGLSMETTLQNGDRLIVNKLPKTISNLTGKPYLPSRGDIIVFDRPPQLFGDSSVEHLIKRVIALPGERITISNHIITVFNKDHPSGFNPEKDSDYANRLPVTLGEVDITVGMNELFVMGDNRINSADSRKFGTINIKLVVGKATVRFVPLNKMKKL